MPLVFTPLAEQDLEIIAAAMPLVGSCLCFETAQPVQRVFLRVSAHFF